ncbi:unnamed protein product [Camellia sinensis]
MSLIQLKSLVEEMQAVSEGLERVEQELTASENDGAISADFQKIGDILGTLDAMATKVHNDLPIDDDDVVVEVGRGNSGPWPQANEALFITLMDEEVNRHAKRFRKKGTIYYHELSRILGDTSATGKLAHPSTKSPFESSASSDPEFKVKNKDLDALQIDSDNDNGDGQGKCKGKSKMAGRKSKKRSSFQANISEALKEMSENSKKNVDLMEKQLTSASVTNVGDDSGSIKGGSTASRSLLKECMALLHAMEEIPAPAYIKAMNKLASDPMIREVFVDMPAGRMRD